MSWANEGWRNLRRVFRLPLTRKRIDQEVDDELRFHLEGRIEELMEREQLTRAAAEREARKRFGDFDAYRREARDIDDRTMRYRSRIELLDTLTREIRHSAHVLLRTPAFSLITFITLAIGIGATTAIYTVVDEVVLRPLPYRNADRIVSVMHPATVPGSGESKWGLSQAGYLYFKEQNHSFEDLGAYMTGTMTILSDQGAEQVRRGQVTASLFTTLQARAALGRLITPQDDQPNGPPIVVLSYEYWQRHFGGARTVVGTMLQTSGVPRQIIGVAEPGLSLPRPGAFSSKSDLAGFGVDVWTPMQLNPNDRPVNSHQYAAIGRLEPGVTPEAAQRDLSALMRDFPSKFPTAYTDKFISQFNFRVSVLPMRDEVLGPTLAKALWVLFGAVAIVLFIACANVANLFLVRMEARRRESAIRTALGADRAHMAIHFLSESLLLTVAAALAGIVVARIGLGAILAIAPVDIARLSTVRLNGMSALFALTLALVAGVVFGLIPLARTAVDVRTLREGGRGMTASSGQRAVRNGLVVGQVALALVLLAAAGLMLRSFANLRNVKSGLNPAGVVVFETSLPFSDFKTREQISIFQQEFQRRVAALPGVQRVGATNSLPLQDYANGCTSVFREGRPYEAKQEPPCVATEWALPGFYESLGIQVRGRTPAWSDVDPTGKSRGTAVVTKALADRLWPNEEPIGMGINAGGGGGLQTVVGVIPELRGHGLDQPPSEAVIVTALSGYTVWTVKTASGDPSTLVPGVRRILAEMNPRVPVVNARTMGDVVARSTSRASFIMTLLALAGSMALLLSALGIYGVISYLVTQRRSEIGVRVALGARLPQVAALILGQSMRLTVFGVVIGLVAAVLGMRVLGSLLFEVSPTDPAVLIGTAVTLVLIAAVASLAPTRRAARIDPVEAMRGA
ncbi:MAG: permease [Gemmatimonadetes bacterium]|nr:permease [Gemmatimonadota bacterium]